MRPRRFSSTLRALPLAFACATGLLIAPTRADLVTRPDHLVIVVEENHSDQEILGNPSAPYINSLAARSVNFTNAYGVEHPSLPNYLDLFSGSNKGVHDDNADHIFSAPNLGSQLLNAGLTFAGYSENQPGVGALDLSAAGALYARKHNPWSEFQGTGLNQLPATVNLPFTAFPTDYSQLPTVSIIAPNQINDMHGVSGGPTGNDLVAAGDTWLKNNLDPYVQWAATHNSALWVIWDEDDYAGNNKIASFINGPMFAPGINDQFLNHYGVLGTVEDMYGLPRIAGAVGQADPLATPEPSSVVLAAIGGVCVLIGGATRSRRRRA